VFVVFVVILAISFCFHIDAVQGGAPAKQVTVSGISSGGYFAAQYQFAHSANVSGAAVFAGGPYFCAMDVIGFALTACMSQPQLIELPIIEEAVKGFAALGSIDEVSNLANHKIYIFSGTLDTIVAPGVVKALEQEYLDLGVPSMNIKTEYSIAAEHAMPTKTYGNQCSYQGTPWINNCTYDGAGVALKWLLGGQLKPAVPPISKNIKQMSQQKFTPGGANPNDLSLAATGYVYMPSACQKKGATCRVHVAFHGCQQYAGRVGTVFVENAGYNGWAESNNLIVVYPQTTASAFMPYNPEGCYDWWGYLDYGYMLQSGRQIQTVKNMVDYFASGGQPA